mmetsp:Transcript_69468/g.157018  ORF Transcript_69468/g.157018 Transcript_69468/m.157018 type:complete len:201 (-) Transcript_69468:70-672(-)
MRKQNRQLCVVSQRARVNGASATAAVAAAVSEGAELALSGVGGHKQLLCGSCEKLELLVLQLWNQLWLESQLYAVGAESRHEGFNRQQDFGSGLLLFGLFFFDFPGVFGDGMHNSSLGFKVYQQFLGFPGHVGAWRYPKEGRRAIESTVHHTNSQRAQDLEVSVYLSNRIRRRIKRKLLNFKVREAAFDFFPAVAQSHPR